MNEVPQPQPIIIQQTGGRLFSRLGWLGFLVCGLLLYQSFVAKQSYFDTSSGVQEKFHSGGKRSDDKIAIISVTGMIIESEGGFVRRQIDRVMRDDRVQAVVVRVDSPGGTVTASDYIYHHLKKLREERDIPIVVSMGSIAASGGYYVAMAVGDEKDVIFAEPTTTTGSIGVIIPHYNISGLLERYDIKDDSIASHPRKQMLAMTRPIPDEHAEIIQSHVDEAFQRFKDIVKSGRPAFRDGTDDLKYEQVDLATGEIFSAPKAQQYGLIDRVGFLEDAVERAAELASLDASEVRVVRYKNLNSLFDFPSLTMQQGRSELDLLFELSAPKAYYLSTSLPPLFRSRR